MKHIVENSFYAYVLMLLAFFILLFFTRNIYSETQIVSDELEQKNINLTSLESEHKELSALKKKFENFEGEWENELKDEIKGFSGDFSDSDILEYIHSYVQKENEDVDQILIRTITIGEAKKTDIGFNSSRIVVDAVFSSEGALFDFIDHHTNGTGKYKFYISSLSYPMNKTGGKLQVSIPLTLYYR